MKNLWKLWKNMQEIIEGLKKRGILISGSTC